MPPRPRQQTVRRPRVAGLRDPRRLQDAPDAPDAPDDPDDPTPDPKPADPEPADPELDPAPDPEPTDPRAEPAPATRTPRAVAALVTRLERSRTVVPVALLAVVVVAVLLAGLAFWAGHRARTDGPVADRAVVDEAATAEVVGQTREDVEKIFSYDWEHLDDSVTAARTLSTGGFTQQYLDVFERTIRGPAGQQRLRQTASVLDVGVQHLTGDRATLMAMVQFSAQRTTTGQATNAPGLLRLEMQRVDGRWKLGKLEPLTAPH